MRPNPQILLLALLGCGDESTDPTRLQPIVADEVMGIALHDAVGALQAGHFVDADE